jgi:hypothetical protein
MFHASRFTHHVSRFIWTRYNMPMSELSTLKELPPLMPQFLRKRRAGLAAPRLIAEGLGVEPPLLFTLMQLRLTLGSYGRSVTLAEARDWSRYLYSTRDHLTEQLAALKESGLVEEDADSCFTLAPQAWQAVEDVHKAGRAHVAGLQPLPPEELEALRDQLARAVEAILRDPVLSPRPGSHLAGSRSLDTFGRDAPVMVRIEQAIYDLWLARDDAHIKTWRDAGMEGPPMQVLTLLWSGEVSMFSGLTQMLRDDQTSVDVEASLAFLFDKEYVERDGDDLKLTPAGVLAREDIESDTDLVYFASWPHTTKEVEWMRDKMRELIGNL